MVLVPLAVFYILFIFVFNRDKSSLGTCGIAAVIATNVVIGSYVVMAWHEDNADPSRVSADKTKAD